MVLIVGFSGWVRLSHLVWGGSIEIEMEMLGAREKMVVLVKKRENVAAEKFLCHKNRMHRSLRKLQNSENECVRTIG